MINEKVDESGFKPSETWRIMKNVAVVSFSFMLLFTGYHGATNLQSSINADAGLGTTSLAAVYAGIILSNIFLPAIVIKWMGTKWAICFSIITYMPYIAVAQLYPTFYTMIPTAFLMGLGAAPLWCAKCTYLAMIAQVHSTLSKIPADALLPRFLGFFFMIYQMNQIWGNLISSLVLSSGDNAAAVTSVNESMIPEMCGANFLINLDDVEATLPSQPLEIKKMMTVIYLTCMVAATFLAVVGLDSIKRYELSPALKTTGRNLSGLALLAVTMKQLVNPNQLLLLVINIFIGLQHGFIGADFSASYVSCAMGIGSVGYVLMGFGIANVAACLVTGYMAKFFGRLPLVIGALLIHIGVFVTMLAWRPHAGESYVLYLLAVLWGVCDSVWSVQINAYYGILFRGNEEAAYANYGMWEAIGYILSYIISSYIRTRYKIYILLFTLIVGFFGYLMVEYREDRREKKLAKKKIDLPQNWSVCSRC